MYKKLIDDPDGAELFGDIAFLPDNTLVLAYHHGNPPESGAIRVIKFINGNWEEFSPGSATGNGIADTSADAANPQLKITHDGQIYVLWMQKYLETYGIYIKKWNGLDWVEVGKGSAEGFGISPAGGEISIRALALDEHELPIATYTQNGKIYVRRFNGIQWQEMGLGSDVDNGLCEPQRIGKNSIIITQLNSRPLILWRDVNPLFPNDAGPLYAKEFTGTSWIPAGEGAASGNGIGVGDFFFDAVYTPENHVIVAYAAANQDIYVKKYLPSSVGTETPVSTPIPSPTPTPIRAWFVLDGFGGIHSTNLDIKPPILPYFPNFNIVRDIEPDPLGRGWYMLDGYGGIHTSSPDLPKPIDLPYFGFDIARRLKVIQSETGWDFYLLDGFGVVHSTNPPFSYGKIPWFGVDIARDLDYVPQTQEWRMLDAFGLLFSNLRSIPGYPLAVAWNNPLVRSITLFPDNTNVVLDAFGGRHTNSNYPARDVLNGLPLDFYFPGWDIIWDAEIVPENWINKN